MLRKSATCHFSDAIAVSLWLTQFFRHDDRLLIRIPQLKAEQGPRCPRCERNGPVPLANCEQRRDERSPPPFRTECRATKMTLKLYSSVRSLLRAHTSTNTGRTIDCGIGLNEFEITSAGLDQPEEKVQDLKGRISWFK